MADLWRGSSPEELANGARWKGIDRSTHWEAVKPSVKVKGHIEALFRLLVMQQNAVSEGLRPADRVQLGVSTGPDAERALQSLRTLRNTHTGSPRIELFYEERHGSLSSFIPDDEGPPSFEGVTPGRWAGYLSAWQSIEPEGLARELVELAPDRLRLYPQLSKSTTNPEWSLRLDGLQIGLVRSTVGHLKVGGGDSSSHIATMHWRSLPDAEPKVELERNDRSIEKARSLIEQFIRSFDGVPGRLLDHGNPEHALESSIVRGKHQIRVGGRKLSSIVRSDSYVVRGSQIPTQWAKDGKACYLDALMRDEHVPWAVEMKVLANNDYGPYLQYAIGQAVLYRHFLCSAPAYQAWFASHNLDQQAVRAAVLYPQPPDNVRQEVAKRISALWLLAAAFDVQVVTVDAGWLR
jgi:hypothetical protein